MFEVAKMDEVIEGYYNGAKGYDGSTAECVEGIVYG